MIQVPTKYAAYAGSYRRGFFDAREGRSDFVRRSMKGDARLAYMAGRTAGASVRRTGEAACSSS